MGSGNGPAIVASALIGAGTNLINGHLARKQTDRITKENQELTIRMEAERQDFQIELFDKNANLQRSLNQDRHRFALDEIQANFQAACESAEWRLFLERWPLVVLPSVVRQAQILPDNTVALRVIFSHSNDAQFNALVYPYVEQRLREFVDLYCNQFDARNILFYHKGFSSTFHGGALEENIHYALKEIPVMILDANVINAEIVLSVTLWGFGSAEKKHCTIARLPYEKKPLASKPDQDYYQGIADQILAHAKFITGYTYDVYNLVEYDRAPLLGKVLQYELSAPQADNICNQPQLAASVGEEYQALFDQVFAPNALSASKSYILPQLQLSFAESMREFLSLQQYCRALDASLASWVRQRSQTAPEQFLRQLASGEEPIRRYARPDDIEYLSSLAAAYAWPTTQRRGNAQLLDNVISAYHAAPALPAPSAKAAAGKAHGAKPSKPGLITL